MPWLQLGELVPGIGKSLCPSVLKVEETMKYLEGSKAGQRACKQLSPNQGKDP